MRLRPTLSLALALVLSTPLALAQQPDTPSSPAQAQPAPHPRMVRDSHRDVRDRMDRSPHPGFFFSMHGMWWKNPDLVKSLNITPEQQKKMDDILQKSRLELIDLRAALEKQEVILHPMMDENPPDTNKILAQIDRVAQARADLEKGNARMLLGIRGVLTPDQWTKLQTDHALRHRMAIQRFHRDDHDGSAAAPAPPPPPGL